MRLMAPLIVWFCGSVLLLSWSWFENALERTTLVFWVAVEGGPPAEELSVKLDGKAFQSGGRVGLGSHTLFISGPTVEPCRKKAFVWLGRNDWGRVDLKRIKGILDVQTEPAATELRIAGALFSATKADTAGFSQPVPAGEYQVTAVFLHTRERREAEVLRNETCRSAIAPPFGALDLASDPKGVEYSLRSPATASLSFSGTAPAELTQLPAGAYDLSMQWAGSDKDRQLQIAAGKTNRQDIVFPYGTVRLTTTPPGAAVSSGWSALGNTPRTLLVKPGRYDFHLALDGYRPLDVALSVADKQTVAVVTNLVSLRYVEAMTVARGQFNSANYDAALRRVQAALQVEPQDADALSLKAKIEAAQKAAGARAAEAVRQAQAAKEQAAREAPVKAARRKFNLLVSREKDARLFPTFAWAATNRLADVEAAMRRLFAEKDAPWKLAGEENPDARTVIFRGAGRGLIGSHERRCFVMLARVGPGRTCVFAEFFEYVLPVQLASLIFSASSTSYVPVTATTYKPDEPGAAAAHIKAVAEDFIRRLEAEGAKGGAP